MYDIDEPHTNGEPQPDPDAEGRAAWEAWDYPKLGETPYTAFLAGFAAAKDPAHAV